MSLAAVVRDIRALKIQGAEHIAIAAVRAFQSVLQQHRNSPQLSAKLAEAHTQLIAARPTEPFLRNCLNTIIHHEPGIALTLTELERRIQLVLRHITAADTHILRYSQSLIPKRVAIYTHCHSSTVTKAIIDAAARGCKITVRNTETRPLYQGRITAAELAAAHIPVFHYVDAGMRLAIKASDIALLGADAITVDGKVINKIGSELAAETAYRYGVPLYIYTNAWKFDPAAVSTLAEPIEERPTAEIWKGAPKGVQVQNPAFERIHPRWITAIISELGINPPKQFVKLVQERYPLLATE